jgi:hypothetical protein
MPVINAKIRALEGDPVMVDEDAPIVGEDES